MVGLCCRREDDNVVVLGRSEKALVEVAASRWHRHGTVEDITGRDKVVDNNRRTGLEDIVRLC
jgi:hypothetical protein